ncbi:MAG: response regulator [Bacteroidota bacterium]
MRILLIEDNPADILLAREALKEIGFNGQLLVETDGLSALKYLDQLATNGGLFPDLILLDLNLPKVDGLEVLKMIKESSELQSIPTVVLSTSDDSMDMKKSRKLNANNYLVKPLDFAEFIDMLRGTLTHWDSDQGRSQRVA